MPFRRYFINFYGRKKISFDFIFSMKMMSKISLNDLLIIVLNTSINIILSKSISIEGVKKKSPIAAFKNATIGHGHIVAFL